MLKSTILYRVMAKMILESKAARKLLTYKQLSNDYSSKVEKKPKVKRIAVGILCMQDLESAKVKLERIMSKASTRSLLE